MEEVEGGRGKTDEAREEYGLEGTEVAGKEA